MSNVSVRGRRSSMPTPTVDYIQKVGIKSVEIEPGCYRVRCLDGVTRLLPLHCQIEIENIIDRRSPFEPHSVMTKPIYEWIIHV